MEKCFALRQLAQNQFQTDGIRDEILSSYTLSCMSYHTMYPILVHKNLSVMAGFEPASDTSKPKEGSRSMSSTTGEGRQMTTISLPLFQKPTKTFRQTEWSVTLTINQQNLSQYQYKKMMQEIKDENESLFKRRDKTTRPYGWFSDSTNRTLTV